ncbi:hypothetical protein MG293_001062 [Ovis ammon polii]|uniref:Ig-like domain-containing protein n=1 Tax=Ovis ammon polii TaxID=230172 RepID=A0AAD4ULH0_OVIAM|nr:hypothetical protein MG293_001062 [Ovis ammon polii]
MGAAAKPCQAHVRGWDGSAIRRTLSKGRSAKVIQFNTGNQRQCPGVTSRGKESETIYDTRDLHKQNRITLRSTGNQHNIGNPLYFRNNRDYDVGVSFQKKTNSAGNEVSGKQVSYANPTLGTYPRKSHLFIRKDTCKPLSHSSTVCRSRDVENTLVPIPKGSATKMQYQRKGENGMSPSRPQEADSVTGSNGSWSCRILPLIRRTLSKGRSAKVIQFNTGNQRQCPGVTSRGKESETIYDTRDLHKQNRITLRSTGNQHNIGNPLYFRNNRDYDVGVSFQKKTNSAGNEVSGKQVSYANPTLGTYPRKSHLFIRKDTCKPLSHSSTVCRSRDVENTLVPIPKGSATKMQYQRKGENGMSPSRPQEADSVTGSNGSWSCRILPLIRRTLSKGRSAKVIQFNTGNQRQCPGVTSRGKESETIYDTRDLHKQNRITLRSTGNQHNIGNPLYFRNNRDYDVGVSFQKKTNSAGNEVSGKQVSYANPTLGTYPRKSHLFIRKDTCKPLSHSSTVCRSRDVENTLVPIPKGSATKMQYQRKGENGMSPSRPQEADSVTGSNGSWSCRILPLIRRTLSKGRSAKVIQFNTGNQRQCPGVTSRGKESETIYDTRDLHKQNRITLRSTGNQHNIGNPLYFRNNRDYDVGVSFQKKTNSAGNEVSGKQVSYANPTLGTYPRKSHLFIRKDTCKPLSHSSTVCRSRDVENTLVPIPKGSATKMQYQRKGENGMSPSRPQEADSVTGSNGSWSCRILPLIRRTLSKGRSAKVIQFNTGNQRQCPGVTSRGKESETIYDTRDLHKQNRITLRSTGNQHNIGNPLYFRNNRDYDVGVSFQKKTNSAGNEVSGKQVSYANPTLGTYPRKSHLFIRKDTCKPLSHSSTVCRSRDVENTLVPIPKGSATKMQYQRKGENGMSPSRPQEADSVTGSNGSWSCRILPLIRRTLSKGRSAKVIQFNTGNQRQCPGVTSRGKESETIYDTRDLHKQNRITLRSTGNQHNIGNPLYFRNNRDYDVGVSFQKKTNSAGNEVSGKQVSYANPTLGTYPRKSHLFIRKDTCKPLSHSSTVCRSRDVENTLVPIPKGSATKMQYQRKGENGMSPSRPQEADSVTGSNGSWSCRILPLIRRTLSKGRSAKVIQFNTGNQRQCPGVTSRGKESETIYDTRDLHKQNRITLRSTGNQHNIGNPLYFRNNRDYDVGVSFQKKTNSAGNEVSGKQVSYANPTLGTYPRKSHLFIRKDTCKPLSHSSTVCRSRDVENTLVPIPKGSATKMQYQRKGENGMSPSRPQEADSVTGSNGSWSCRILPLIRRTLSKGRSAKVIQFNTGNQRQCPGVTSRGKESETIYDTRDLHKQNRITLRSTGNQHNIGNPLYFRNNRDYDVGVSFQKKTNSAGNEVSGKQVSYANPTLGTYPRKSHLFVRKDTCNPHSHSSTVCHSRDVENTLVPIPKGSATKMQYQRKGENGMSPSRPQEADSVTGSNGGWSCRILPLIRRTLSKGRSAKVIQFNTGNQRQCPGVTSRGKESETIYDTRDLHKQNRITLRSTGNQHNIGNPLYFRNNRDYDVGVSFQKKTNSAGNEVSGKQVSYANPTLGTYPRKSHLFVRKDTCNPHSHSSTVCHSRDVENTLVPIPKGSATKMQYQRKGENGMSPSRPQEADSVTGSNGGWSCRILPLIRRTLSKGRSAKVIQFNTGNQRQCPGVTSRGKESETIYDTRDLHKQNRITLRSTGNQHNIGNPLYFRNNRDYDVGVSFQKKTNSAGNEVSGKQVSYANPTLGTYPRKSHLFVRKDTCNPHSHSSTVCHSRDVENTLVPIPKGSATKMQYQRKGENGMSPSRPQEADSVTGSNGGWSCRILPLTRLLAKMNSIEETYGKICSGVLQEWFKGRVVDKIRVEDGDFMLSTGFLEDCPITSPSTNQKKVIHHAALTPNFPYKNFFSQTEIRHPSRSYSLVEDFLLIKKKNQIEDNIVGQDRDLEDSDSAPVPGKRDLPKAVVNIQPAWINVLREDHVTLMCQGTSFYAGNLTTWFHNGSSIHTQNQPSYSFRANSNDSGSYRCQREQTSLSDPVHLDVISDWLLLQTPSLVFQEGEPIVLRCHSWRNHPLSKITFYQDGKSKTFSYLRSNFSIPRANLSHSGQYHCTAFLGKTPHSSQPVNITVQDGNEGCSRRCTPWKDG